jgi:lipopolysaccharide cholinephosphotransferase
MLEILKGLAKILDENGIQWWLSSGTLLGAARHGGFIPWDDDMDVVVLRKDWKRLRRVLENMNNGEFVFQTMHTDIEYVNTWGRFRSLKGDAKAINRRHVNFKWRGRWIDVFAIEKTNYFSARAAKVIYGNLQHITVYIHNAWLRRFLIRFIEILCLGFINSVLRLVGKINTKQEYRYVLGSGWPHHKFFMKDTFPLAVADFEGLSMPVPKDMDSYLTNVYGNWRQLPSDEQIKKSLHCQEYIDEIFENKNKAFV